MNKDKNLKEKGRLALNKLHSRKHSLPKVVSLPAEEWWALWEYVRVNPRPRKPPTLTLYGSEIIIG